MYSNQPIRSDDENAIEKLREKAEALRKLQEDMKKANKHYKEFGSMQGFEGMTEEEAFAFNNKIEGRYSYDRQPYPSWALQNNYQNMRTTEKRLKALERESTKEDNPFSYDTSHLG